ncbi:stabilizer of axonemal microtubules 1-like isoform X1 [Protopterus annectens]|uniref:stabilizer of axonemal microtubules 1-like isoform X1 n=2 Tax=Protopterus annectens TaxID=7888 RepID=UPI001CF9C728|nr:stabilizer of axonemal microtubules 1-like isoform X1 [Protopterus annectens]
MTKTVNSDTADFPEFACLCELCDCGRHKHHKGCKKRNASIQQCPINKECLLTHYKSTFINPQNVHPRSSKRPLRTPPHPRHPPMKFETTQRREFIPREPQERTKPFIRKEYYEPSKEPFESETAYNIHFPAKQPIETIAVRPVTSLKPSHLKFNDSTSNKEFFKNWKPDPLIRYGEAAQVMAGALLFPDQPSEMKTTNQVEFVEKLAAKPELIKNVQCHLTIEGDHEMMTTHQTMFQPLPLGKPALRRIQPVDRGPVMKRAHMETITKYQSDFPGYRSLPERNHLVPPPMDNLGVNHSLNADFSTVQRETFKGWDAAKHRRPDPITLKEELSEMEKNREGKFDGDTVTKISYPPLQLSRLQLDPIKRSSAVLKPHSGKFEDSTANKFFFKDWGAQPRVRHGDPSDGVYVRPLGRFESITTTRSTFVPKKAEMVQNCKPPHKPVEAEGEHEFITVQQESYRPIAFPVCRLQTYLQQQALKKNVEDDLNLAAA